nr:hypothetical protein [Lysobacter enzymogenes]
MVRAADAVELAEEPQPALIRGQRRGGGAGAGLRLFRGGGGAAQRVERGGLRGQGRVPPDRADRQLDPPLSAQPAEQARGAQRMPAEGEEIVVAADAFAAEQFLPQPRKLGFAAGSRRAVVAAAVGAVVGGGSAARSSLLALRQRRDHDDRGRAQRFGQALAQVFAQGGGEVGAAAVAGRGRGVRDQLQRAFRAGARDGRGFAHARMRGQLRGDLAGSTRKPRILTCSSLRPRNSSSPPGRRRARSPLRYMRAPGRGSKGSAGKRCALSSSWCR